jgi:hypothetical protein
MIKKTLKNIKTRKKDENKNKNWKKQNMNRISEKIERICFGKNK